MNTPTSASDALDRGDVSAGAFAGYRQYLRSIYEAILSETDLYYRAFDHVDAYEWALMSKKIAFGAADVRNTPQRLPPACPSPSGITRPARLPSTPRPRNDENHTTAMDAQLQRRIQRYGWDRAASHYERSWQQQLAPAQACLLTHAALQPGERVLDVACGTGLVTFPAAEAVGPGGFVFANDLSDRMVEHVRTEAQRRQLPQVVAEQMDAEALSVPDASYDAALCALGLMYVPNPERALREMRRALRPGGRAVAAVWGRRNRCGWAGIFPVVDARVRTEVCPLFFHLGTGDMLARAFEAAGFTGVESERLTTTLRYADDEEACAAAFAGGPVALAYARFDDRTRAEAHADYLATIASYRTETGYAIPGEFVITWGSAS